MTDRKDTPLEAELKTQIAQDGPLPVAHYMALALGHPKYGYYMRGDPFGARGDFITAPEVSQMFGELIGVWCAAAYRFMGDPERFALVELGPGRGSLMADLLRAASVMPGFREAAELHLVETSPVLANQQKIKLKGAAGEMHWHAALDDVPDMPLIVIANEFFDALPIQQMQLTEGGWRERVVGLQGDQLTMGLGGPASAPAYAAAAEPGAIAEVSAARDAAARIIGQRIAVHGGAGLIIDYGHMESACGDTLQAMSKHGYVDILERPGQCDVTSHVDFEALAAEIEAGGAKTHGPVPQGPFLLSMGLQIRAEKLREKAMRRQARHIDSAVERLAAREQMGELFKVLAVTHPDYPTPAPFEGLTA
ncbi:MAG: SAM-dependent methyltransferase [Pseudomonadota bacterium]